jgi:hypothetical protein
MRESYGGPTRGFLEVVSDEENRRPKSPGGLGMSPFVWGCDRDLGLARVRSAGNSVSRSRSRSALTVVGCP